MLPDLPARLAQWSARWLRRFWILPGVSNGNPARQIMPRRKFTWDGNAVWQLLNLFMPTYAARNMK